MDVDNVTPVIPHCQWHVHVTMVWINLMIPSTPMSSCFLPSTPSTPTASQNLNSKCPMTSDSTKVTPSGPVLKTENSKSVSTCCGKHLEAVKDELWKWQSDLLKRNSPSTFPGEGIFLIQSLLPLV